MGKGGEGGRLLSLGLDLQGLPLNRVAFERGLQVRFLHEPFYELL